MASRVEDEELRGESYEKDEELRAVNDGLFKIWEKKICSMKECGLYELKRKERN